MLGDGCLLACWRDPVQGLLCWEMAAYLHAGVIQWRRRVCGREEVIAEAEQLMGKRAEDTSASGQFAPSTAGKVWSMPPYTHSWEGKS